MTHNDIKKVAVIGAGAWGTALATILANNHTDTVLWGRNAAVVDSINTEHSTPYLPNIALPAALRASTDLGETVKDCDMILFAVPSVHLFNVIDQVQAIRPLKEITVLWATKGVDQQNGRFINDVLHTDYKVQNYAMISGPSFALEVAQCKPVALDIVCKQATLQEELARLFQNNYVRVYAEDDFIGSQLCGIVKNVLSIASGVCDGLNMGLNARSALLTRGLVELKRLIVAAGGHEETVYGLCGLGDVILTATGDLSRNRRFGLALAKYGDVQQAIDAIGTTIEGLNNITWLQEFMSQYKVSMPICEIIYEIVQGNCKPKDAIKKLMLRGR